MPFKFNLQRYTEGGAETTNDKASVAADGVDGATGATAEPSSKPPPPALAAAVGLCTLNQVDT